VLGFFIGTGVLLRVEEGVTKALFYNPSPFVFLKFPLTNHIILFVVGNVFWLAYCMALGFFIFYVPVFSFLFLFPFISNHNLSELNERYEHRIPQNARRARRKSKGVGSLLERGGERRCGKAERARGNETIPYHLGVGSIISIGWFKKGHGSGSKV
jgi:hypothetical protein